MIDIMAKKTQTWQFIIIYNNINVYKYIYNQKFIIKVE